MPYIVTVFIDLVRMIFDLFHAPFIYSFVIGIFLPHPSSLKKILLLMWSSILLTCLLFQVGNVEVKMGVIGVFIGFNLGVNIPTYLRWKQRIVFLVLALGLISWFYIWFQFHPK